MRCRDQAADRVDVVRGASCLDRSEPNEPTPDCLGRRLEKARAGFLPMDGLKRRFSRLPIRQRFRRHDCAGSRYSASTNVK